MNDEKVTCPECGNKYFLDEYGEVVKRGTCIPDCPLEIDFLEEDDNKPLNFHEEKLERVYEPEDWGKDDDKDDPD